MNNVEELISKMCPDGVPMHALGEIGETISGLRGKSKGDFSDGNAPFVSYVDISNNPALNFEVQRLVKVEAGENQNEIRLGDVLITGSSETKVDVGLTSVVTVQPKLKTYINSFCFIWRPHKELDLLPDFSKYLFRGRKFRDEVIKTANGVTRQNVSKPKLLAIRIPIPPLEIQKEIVSILNVFTELETNLESEIMSEIEARQRQRTFIFNGLSKGTLPLLKDAPKVQLKDLVDFENGKPHETLVNPAGDCELITSKFISSNGKLARRINKEDIRTPTFIDDIPIVLSDLPNGRALAKCFFVKKNNQYAVNQRIAILRSKDISIADPEYLYHFVNRNPQILRFDNGSTQTHLKKDDVINMFVLLPEIEIQKKIAKSLTELDLLILSLTKDLEAEIKVRRQQYEHYRNQFLDFKELQTA